jgi:hypothetical protein
LLIADADETSTSAPRRVTVGSMFNDALNNGIYTTGSFTNRVTAGSFVGNLTGDVTGTIVGTSGTIATLNSTTSTITNLSATTSTFLGTITGSTNVINIGGGQIYKSGDGDVYFGATSKPVSAAAAKVQVVGSGMALASNTAFTPQIGLFGAHSSSAPYVIFSRAKGSYSSPTTVSSSDLLGNLYYGGHDGTSYVNAAGVVGVVDGAVSTGTVPTALTFLTGNGNNNERLRIESNGNVGIGTTGANSKLEVKIAVAKATTAETKTINLSSSDASNALTLELALGTNSTAASRYSSIQSIEPGVAFRDLLLNKDGGNVGIGTGGSSIASKLDVYGVGNFQSLELGKSGQTGNRDCIIDLVGDDTNTDYGLRIARGATGVNADSSFSNKGTGAVILQTEGAGPIILKTTATDRVTIASGGGVTIAGLAGTGSRAVNASATGLLSAASDASLKEEVVGAHIAGLNEILQIHPKMYRWKDDIANRGENASIELGFIANDVAPIIPSAAPLGNDGLYGFYDRSITAALVKSVQELKAENNSLKARIEALEAK